VDVSRLEKNVWRELERQLMAPHYEIDYGGRYVVDDKAITKKELKRSPDGADAFNLAYYPPRFAGEKVAGHIG
jgi:hypothetical protein